MLPNGWERTNLVELIDIKHGFAFKSEFFRDYGNHILLTPGSFYESGGFRDQGVKTKYYAGVIPDAYLLSKEDLLVAMTEQGAGLLGSTLFVPESNLFLHNQRLGKIVIKYREKICKDFIFLTFNSPPIRKQISEQSTGTKVKHTSPDKLKSVVCLLPPLPEQKKIATILSTWDKSISTTERLIDNSKQQKKALMQQLLTGKKRLLDDSGKPFEGEWEWCTLDKVSDVKGGKRLPKGNSLTDIPNSHPYIRVADMFMGGVDVKNILYVPEEIVPSIKNYTISKDDLFITVAGTLGIVGEIPPLLDGANLTENADKLTNISCNKKFLLYVLKSPIIQRYVDAESTQNAQPKLALARIRSFKVPLPKPIEQKKIASILSNADKETKLLEQQLADLKQEKKALMQQLLTGSRRVKLKIKEDL